MEEEIKEDKEKRFLATSCHRMQRSQLTNSYMLFEITRCETCIPTPFNNALTYDNDNDVGDDENDIDDDDDVDNYIDGGNNDMV